MFQPGANLYTQGFGSKPENVEVPHIERRAPGPTDVNFPVGKTWLDNVTNTQYILYSFSVSNGVTIANWDTVTLPSGGIDTLSNGTTKVSPDGTGNIAITGSTNEVTVTSNAGSNLLNLSFPSTMIAPGSLQVENGFSVSNGAVDIQSGTNALNIDTIATGDVNIGQITGGQTVTILGGSGGVNIDSASGSIIHIGDVLSTNNSIHLGNSNTSSINMASQDIELFTYGSGINLYSLGGGALTLNQHAGAGSIVVGNSLNTITLGSNSTSLMGALLLNNTFVAGTYTMVLSDCFLNCDTTGAVTINLIAAGGFGQVLVIVDTLGLAGANNITINAPAGGNILVSGASAAPNYVINQNYGNIILIGVTGNDYFVIAQG